MEAMGADDRLPDAAVIDRLAANPAAFNLFQAIGLLERATPGAHPLGHGDGSGEAVRLRGLVSLAFQPRDVASVVAGAPQDADHADNEPPREAGQPPYTLTTPALSLAGANGPLPLPYTELLLERRAARDHAMAELLDIFNHRFLSFLYRGRVKHAPGLGAQAPATTTLAGCLDALSNLGLRAGPRGPGGAAPWLRHAGLLGAAPRSMEGLLALLGDRLGLRVRGRQFVGGWLAVERTDSVRLGARGAPGTQLGGGAVLGRRCWDQSAGIGLDLQVPDARRLEGLLPGGPDHGLVAWLVRSHASQPFDVQLALQVAERPATRLGGGARLGWTAWLAGGAAARPAPVRLSLRVGADTLS
ncbi:type VI secretion system baseplate subunit TssG [Cupriavidus pinatubonensis]|uniref:type VI secretion system baseplate subunit TssG n=1 Tax=Cupriavidus pinatubonensis TaxID=248026 RepID=UPI001FD45251|nr:type VI secretion system baseplate subunit TssG [Cupriavidus pinatubonensis]